MFGMQPAQGGNGGEQPAPPKSVKIPALREFKIVYPQGDEFKTATVRAHSYQIAEGLGVLEFFVYRRLIEGRPPLGQPVRAFRDWVDIDETVAPEELPEDPSPLAI